MVDELQHGNHQATEGEPLDGRMAHELSTRMMGAEHPTVVEIVHLLGHPVLKLRLMVFRMVSQLARRHLVMVEMTRGVPKPLPTNHNSSKTTTPAGASMLMMLPRLARICLLLLQVVT